MDEKEDAGELSSLDGQFTFKRLSDGSLSKSTVVCKLCSKEFAFHRSYSSLRYHLNAKHIVASTGATNKVEAMKQSCQPKLYQMTGFKGKMSKSTSDKLTNSLGKGIAVNCRPLSVVEDKGLEKVLQIASSDPTFELPCRKTISNKMHQLYDTEKQAKVDVLIRAECVALTGDYWTSVSNSNYLGVTAHFIDVIDKDYAHLQSFALTVEKTTSRHYAESCAEQFFSVTEAWGVQHKVTTIATDSARTMIAAARQLPFQHMPCVAHMLQRTITVCLDDSGFNATLAKCRKIVGHFKHSPANSEELHQEQTALGQQKEGLKQDVPTRWNSTLYMITRLLHNQEAVITTLGKQKHKLILLTAAEWDKLQKLADVLEPCRYVTELLGGETYVSCSVVLPALRHLDSTMEVLDEDPAYIARLKIAFKNDISQRRATLNSGWLAIATALDTRFKDLKCLPRGEREGVWNNLEAQLKKDSRATPEPTEEPAKKRCLLLFASDSDSDSEVEPNKGISLYRAESTISVTDCPLHWWSTHAGAHPQLSVLAHKYLASPASSVPCERLFSLAGNIVQKKRAALSAENVNRLVCLSNWLKEKN